MSEIGKTTRRRAMQRVIASVTSNGDTAAVDRTHANGANTLIIKGIPRPIIVSRLQYFQAIRLRQILIHNILFNSIFPALTIGRGALVDLGKRRRSIQKLYAS